MLPVNRFMRRLALLCAAACFFISPAVMAQTPASLSPQLRSSIDDAARQVLKTTGVPSASVAVVQDGKIAYLQAYGDAQLDPPKAATTAMRSSICSLRQ